MEEEVKLTVRNAPYIKVDLEGEPSNYTDFEVREQMVPLLDMLRTRHPTWVFTGGTYPRQSQEIRFIYVLEKGEVLGRITYDSYYGYQVTNKRIEDSMERKTDKCTSDTNVARRIVEKFFKPKTHAETVEEISQRASKITGAFSAQENYEKSKAEREFTTLVTREANADIPATMKRLNIPEDAEGGAGNVPNLRVRAGAAAALHEQASRREGTYLRDMGDKVAVYSFEPVGPEPGASRKLTYNEYEKTDIPHEIKVSYGMLKLVADGDALPDIGVRLDEGYYFICKKEKPSGKTEG